MLRRTMTAVLILSACLACAGCAVTGELENQTYVLVLGVDRLEDGALELTARVPRIGGKARDSAGESAGGGDYMVFSAKGGDFALSMEALEWATPRRLNLSHIEMIVASEALAKEEGFGKVIDLIAETPHLYTTARFVVCEGTARAFIEAEQIVIGTRLSAEIDAMLDHYAARGYIPDSAFADAYYAGNSIYSDPVAIYATLEEEDAPAIALYGSNGRDVTASPTRQRFAGAALLRSGTLAGTLGTVRTALLNLVLGSTRSVVVDCDGRACMLSLDGAPVKRVVVCDSGAELVLRLRLSIADDTGVADPKRIERLLTEELSALVAQCQSLRVDPFGFAEAAAPSFPTVRKWLDYNWRERFAGATADIRVAVRGDQ